MELLAALWIFSPVGLANMGPVIASNIPLLKKFTQSLDGGKKFRGQRIFGSHKTVRGLFAGVLMGAVAGLLQYFIFKIFGWPEAGLTPINYGSLNTILLGAILGFGAIAGDAIKSFFKRQVGIAPGHNWFLFDQSDYIIGGILVSLPFFTLPLLDYLFVIFIGLILHPAINVISWLLRLQDKPL